MIAPSASPFKEPGMNKDAGYLSTHILDTMSGKPAAGVCVKLYAVDGESRRLLTETVTNADGRTDAPVLGGGAMAVGVYELLFDVSDYFASRGIKSDVPFLGLIPIRFGIDSPDEHYHVPLLVSPYSFSTYRGS